MKKIFLAIIVAISVSTAPALLLLVLWDFIFVRLNIMPLAHAASVGFIAGPILFPFVVIGTVISCCRSVAIRMRPLGIALGVLGAGITGLLFAYWCFIFTHGFMG